MLGKILRFLRGLAGRSAFLGPLHKPFVAEDCFLRRVSKKRCIRGGIVTWEAFYDLHSTLSFTYQAEILQNEESIDQYQRDKALPSGDLPGLCRLSFEDLTVSLDPPLPPRRRRVRGDEKYGHLHYVTNCPKNRIHRESMAKLATRNGVVREFVPSGKRR